MYLSMFLKGVNCFLTGLTRFYSDRSLIKYAVIPFVLMVAVSLGFLILAVILTSYQAAKLEQWINTLPPWISWAAPAVSGGTVLAVTVVTLLVCVLTLSTLYETFAGPFFDSLIINYEKKYYGITLQDVPFKRTLKFLLQSLLYGINTLLLSTVLFLPALIVPFLGPLILSLVIGYRIGVTYMLPTGFLRNRTVKEQLSSASGKKASTLGFGVTVYLLFLLPVVSIFLLPGVILGGTELLHCLADQEE